MSVDRKTADVQLKRIVELFPDVVVLGSFGRGMPFVRDVDVLIVGSTREEVARKVEHAFRLRTRMHNHGIRFFLSNVLFDVWVCTKEQRESAELFLEGPTARNVKMRSVARSLGMSLKFDGLWRDERVITLKRKDIEEMLRS